MEVAGLCRMALQASENPSKRQAVHEFAPLPTDRLHRAEVLAKFGQWDLVASGFAQKREAESGTWFDAYNDSLVQVVSLVAMGDLPGYRAAADKFTSNWDRLPDEQLGNTAWLCTFAPDGVTDLTVPVQIVEKRFAAGKPADRQKSGLLFLLGVTLYRAGRIDEAIARLEMYEKTYGKESPPNLGLWIYLAMAHHKKGSAGEARRWLEKARSLKPNTEAHGLEWFCVVRDRLLLKEAEELLSQKSLARP
jgi:hypothetical protein